MCKSRAAREQKGTKAEEDNSGDKTRQRQGSDLTNSAMEISQLLLLNTYHEN